MKVLVADDFIVRYSRLMGTLSRSGVHRVCGAHVLIVEDDEDSAELFAWWLRDAGLSVRIVSDGDRALILASVLRPAVVVIDLGLPTTHGILLMDQLRELTCQYVAVTADASARLPVRCRAAGFGAFFQKPVPRAAFVQSVFVMARSQERTRSQGTIG